METKKGIEEKKCIICGKSFYIDHRTNKRGPLPNPIRTWNSITCSKKCGNKNAVNSNNFHIERRRKEKLQEKKK